MGANPIHDEIANHLRRYVGDDAPNLHFLWGLALAWVGSMLFHFGIVLVPEWSFSDRSGDMVESIVSFVTAAPLATRVVFAVTFTSGTFALILVLILVKRRIAAAGADTLNLAVATLLAEAALGDSRFGTAARAAIERVVRQLFGLSEIEAGCLIDAGEREARGATHLVPYTRIIKDNFSPDKRVGLIEMIWEVVLADGELHVYQDSLLRRIAGLIYVSDRDRGAARKRVLKRRAAAGRDNPARVVMGPVEKRARPHAGSRR